MSERSAQHTADILMIFAGGVLDIVGVIGNIIVFIILSKQSSRSTYALLQAICITDLATLLMHLVFQPLALLGKYYVVSLRPWTYQVVAIGYYVWPALMVCHNIVVWLTALLSLERWLAVCRPLQVKLKLSERRTKCMIVLIFVVALLYNLPRFFEYERCGTASANNIANNNDSSVKSRLNDSISLAFNPPTSNVSTWMNRSNIRRTRACTWTRSAIGEHVIYSYLYGVGAYTLVIFLVPVVAILSLNAHLFWEIRRHNTAMKELSLAQRIERKISKMPFCIAAVFCVFETPVTVANIAESCGVVNGRAWVLLTSISSILMLFKATSNILLYFFCASQFRTSLRDVFCCGLSSASRRISTVSNCSFGLNSLMISNVNSARVLIPQRSNSTEIIPECRFDFVKHVFYFFSYNRP